MYKSYDQNGVASSVQLGKQGDKLHSLGGRIKATDKDDALVPVAVGAPQSGNDAVTLDFLKMKADIRVMGAIANLDTLPTTGQLTNVYYDQAGDQLVYGGTNDAGDANVWDVLDVDKDFMILAVVEIQKADTSVLFQADRLYQYDTVTSDWIDHGVSPAPDMSGVVKQKYTIYNAGDSDFIGESFDKIVKIEIIIPIPFVGDGILHFSNGPLSVVLESDYDLSEEGTYVTKGNSVFGDIKDFAIKLLSGSFSAGQLIYIQYYVE